MFSFDYSKFDFPLGNYGYVDSKIVSCLETILSTLPRSDQVRTRAFLSCIDKVLPAISDTSLFEQVRDQVNNELNRIGVYYV